MKHTIFSILIGIFITLPLLTLAQEYQPLVGIPGVTNNPSSSEGFSQYINALYVLAISIAGILAVLKLVIAGAKYMLSDLVSTKQEAISDIKGALLGLLIILGAVVILLTINRDIVTTTVEITELNTDASDTWREEMRAQQEALRMPVAACEADSDCTVAVCQFLRIRMTCEQWCAAQGVGTTYVRGFGLSVFRGSDRCIIPDQTEFIEAQVNATNEAFIETNIISNETLAELLGDDLENLDESDLANICGQEGYSWDGGQCYDRRGNIIQIPDGQTSAWCSSNDLRYDPSGNYCMG